MKTELLSRRAKCLLRFKQGFEMILDAIIAALFNSDREHAFEAGPTTARRVLLHSRVG